MSVSYPATYKDKHGVEKTTIESKRKTLRVGKMQWKRQTLRMVVRGVEFTGDSFEDFEPSISADSPELASFTFDPYNNLCDCTIECEFPIAVLSGKQTRPATLYTELLLGKPDENGWLDVENLRLLLIVEDKEYQAESPYTAYEDALCELDKTLPEDTFIKTCWTCLYAGRPESGFGSFGDIDCHRDDKRKYLKVKTKQDYRKVKITEIVQETHVCREYKLDKKGRDHRRKHP